MEIRISEDKGKVVWQLYEMAGMIGIPKLDPRRISYEGKRRRRSTTQARVDFFPSVSKWVDRGDTTKADK